MCLKLSVFYGMGDSAAKGCFPRIRTSLKPVGNILKISTQNQESGALICRADSVCGPVGVRRRSLHLWVMLFAVLGSLSV